MMDMRMTRETAGNTGESGFGQVVVLLLIAVCAVLFFHRAELPGFVDDLKRYYRAQTAETRLGEQAAQQETEPGTMLYRKNAASIEHMEQQIREMRAALDALETSQGDARSNVTGAVR